MFKKLCKDTFSLERVDQSKVKEALADEKIVGNLTKLANSLRKISPKSDDFLYFSIVFLKAAESSLLDDKGLPKKLASGEQAWGYFDDNWKWHGNVNPHKNNNSDIFPESQLKKAASQWIGLPLCKDHQSSSVDGIRGIILDTYYDEKFKQVVGLCALDKVNYPDLARKVETGIVRYGSMGTAVETSVCTTCGNFAKTADQYCDHIKQRSAWGEINVGLKPIEYSLVVQPAEPQAILLKCIASLNDYKQEFINNGVEDVDAMLGKLSFHQAKHLEGIMKTACGEDGCSLDKRNKIIRSFFDNNKSLIKKSEVTTEEIEEASESSHIRNYTQSAKTMAELGAEDISKTLIEKVRNLATDDYKPEDLNSDFNYSDPTNGLSSATKIVDTENETLEESNEDDLLGYVNVDNNNELTSLGSHNIKNSIKSLLEGYMNKSRLKKRAELRRKLAYMQGGSEGAEPTEFNKIKEDAKKYWNTDKTMHQTKSDFNDTAEKEKLSRAELQERAMRRMAYMQGGSEGVEPAGYKNEFATEKSMRSEDKHMKQTGTMGGDKGMFPGDAQTKEMLKRAAKYRGLTKGSAYSGPSLKTKLSYERDAQGRIVKSASRFEVYAGDEKVISATASEIFGGKVERNWDWLRSKEYGQRICKYVRAHGLEDAIMLLKEAQAAAPEAPAEEGPMPEMPPMEESADMPAAPMPEMSEEELPMEGSADMDGEDEEEDPAQAAESRLSEMEAMIDEVRDLIGKISDTSQADVDIHVDVGGKEEGGDAEELGALAREVLTHLKKVAVEMDESADEIAMISETYDNLNKISSTDRRRFKKLAGEAIKDSDEIVGEARASIKLAKTIVPTLEKRAMAMEHNADFDVPMNDVEDEFMDDAAEEEDKMMNSVMDDYDASMGFSDDTQDQEDLIAEAILLRRNKREQLLKEATQRFQAAKEKSGLNKVATKQTEQQTSVDRIKSKITETMSEKTASEEKNNYKIKLRRAYDVALDMQKKGLIAGTKSALDRQVDEIIEFDDRAFESFKRSIANMKPVGNVKIASNLGGINVGINNEDSQPKPVKVNANVLSSLWDK